MAAVTPEVFKRVADQWAEVPLGTGAELDAPGERWIEQLIAHIPESDHSVRQEAAAAAERAITATAPLPNPAGRFWFVGSIDAVQRLAHLYIDGNDEGTQDAREFALVGYPDALILHQEYVEHAVFSSAVELTLLTPTDDPTASDLVLRYIGIAEQARVLLEVVAGDILTASAIAPAFADLFAVVGSLPPANPSVQEPA